MYEIIETPEVLRIGASVTLTNLEEILRYHIKRKPGNVLDLKLYLS